jgi:hypothetical protein
VSKIADPLGTRVAKTRTGAIGGQYVDKEVGGHSINSDGSSSSAVSSHTTRRITRRVRRVAAPASERDAFDGPTRNENGGDRSEGEYERRKSAAHRPHNRDRKPRPDGGKDKGTSSSNTDNTTDNNDDGKDKDNDGDNDGDEEEQCKDKDDEECADEEEVPTVVPQSGATPPQYIDVTLPEPGSPLWGNLIALGTSVPIVLRQSSNDHYLTLRISQTPEFLPRYGAAATADERLGQVWRFVTDRDG